MSNITDGIPVVYLAQDDFVGRCCEVAGITLILYEYIVTLDREIGYVWKYRFSATTLVLLLNRLAVLALVIVEVARRDNTTPSVCKSSAQAQYGLVVLLNAIVAVFCALRIFGVSGFNWYYTISALFIGLVNAAVPMYYAITVNDVAFIPIAMGYHSCAYQIANNGNGYFICMLIVTNVQEHTEYVSAYIVSFACAITSELLALIATSIHSARWIRHARQSGMKSALHTILLTGGAIYFLAFLAVNVAAFSTQFWGSTLLNNIINEFQQFMPNILIPRFIYNLRQLSTTQHLDTGTSLQNSGVTESHIPEGSQGGTSVQFASRIVGNICDVPDYRGTESPITDMEYESYNNDTVIEDNHPKISETAYVQQSFSRC